MKRLVTMCGGLVAVLAAIGAVGLSTTSVQAAQAKESQPVAKTQQQTPPKDYTYTAGAGDSYTTMVRKAVQTYGINNHVALGNARIVYIETMMSQQAGSPFLWVGQKVTIKGSDVKAWADKSLKLSQADVTAWGTYVPYINFNTDMVGNGQ